MHRRHLGADSSNSYSLHAQSERSSLCALFLLYFKAFELYYFKSNKFKATVNLDLLWNRDWTKVKER